MILLHTNVISELSKAGCDRSVLVWAQAQKEIELFLCAPVIAELEFGAQLFKRRTGSSKHVLVLEALMSKAYLGRILPMSLEAARLAGHFKASREAAGKPVSSADVYIAGIAAANNAALATRNVRDFEGLDLKLINPFEA